MPLMLIEKNTPFGQEDPCVASMDKEKVIFRGLLPQFSTAFLLCSVTGFAESELGRLA